MALVDVSHPLYTGMPKVLPVLPDVRVEPWGRMADGWPLNTSKLELSSHSGTHIDAPINAVEGGKTIDQLPLDQFVGPVVISRVEREVGDPITVEDILAGGPAPKRGDILFVATGWDVHFGADAYHDHPSFDPEVGHWAVGQGVKMVGTDTFTPDLPASARPDGFDFPLHRILLCNDVHIAENLRGLVPYAGRRLTTWAMPIVVERGDAGQARIALEI